MLLLRYLFTVLSDPTLSDASFIRHLKEAMNTEFFEECTSEEASLEYKKQVYPIIVRMANLRPTYMDIIPLTYFIEIDKPMLYRKKIDIDDRRQLTSLLKVEHIPYVERHLSDFGLTKKSEIFDIIAPHVIQALLTQDAYKTLFLEYADDMLRQKNSSFSWALNDYVKAFPDLMPLILPFIQQHCQTPPYTLSVWESVLSYLQLDTFDDAFIAQLVHPETPVYSDMEHALFREIRRWSESAIVVSPILQALVSQLPQSPDMLFSLQNRKTRKIRSYLPDVHTIDEQDIARVLMNVNMDDITITLFENKELMNPDARNTEIYTLWMDRLIKYKDKTKACQEFLEDVGLKSWYQDVLVYRDNIKHVINLGLVPSHRLTTFTDVLASRKQWLDYTLPAEVEIHL